MLILLMAMAYAIDLTVSDHIVMVDGYCERIDLVTSQIGVTGSPSFSYDMISSLGLYTISLVFYMTDTSDAYIWALHDD